MRKPKKIKELKSVAFTLMLTPTEKELIERLADEKGIPQAQVLKHYFIK